MIERKLGPLASLTLLQSMAYSMSLIDSTSFMVTTGGPLRPEFDDWCQSSTESESMDS